VTSNKPTNQYNQPTQPYTTNHQGLHVPVTLILQHLSTPSLVVLDPLRSNETPAKLGFPREKGCEKHVCFFWGSNPKIPPFSHGFWCGKKTPGFVEGSVFMAENLEMKLKNFCAFR